MRLIPVIDLKEGIVVRGVAGRRAEYRALESMLCDSAAPGAVAAALARNFRPRQIYVADLDAIEGAEPAWNDLAAIAAAGPGLLVDAGVANLERAQKLAAFRAGGRTVISGVIMGLETLPDLALLRQLVSELGVERVVFSLDLRDGVPVFRASELRGATVEGIAAAAIAAGVRRMILLDIVRVGMGGGVGTEALCRSLRAKYPSIEIVCGGGISRAEEITALAAAGCTGVLVASALHDGRIETGHV